MVSSADELGSDHREHDLRSQRGLPWWAERRLRRGDTTYRPTAAPALYLGERSDNTFPVIGEIDSFAHWRSGNVGATGIPASLVNGGKALEYSQLANGANPIPVWYDFNEATGASTWKDSSSNGVSLTATGTILSKPGAGF